MGSILDTIADANRMRVAQERERVPLEVLRERAEGMQSGSDCFRRALARPGLSFICEAKKASPSKGVIDPDFPYVQIARDYERAGADCISCLTEPHWFMGSDQIFAEIRAHVATPMIRKDFTIDEYQIYQAKCLGADAVLLICALLDTRTLARYLELTHDLGMDALVEAHNADEIAQALEVGAHIVGVNNRNLKDFSVDFDNARRLRDMIPPECLYVAESGVACAEDVEALASFGADAALIGEALMRAQDKSEKLAEFRAAAEKGRLSRDAGNCVALKLCGMFREEDVAVMNEVRPDYCGFVVDFPKSHRSVAPARAQELARQLGDGITPVAVVVDRPAEEVAAIVNEGTITTVQLHGSEDEGYVARLRKIAPGATVVKAFEVRTAADVKRACAFPADLLLLDSGKGSGESFDWSITRCATRPFILAGGLDASNLEQAIQQVHPWGVDLSSALETNRKKDPAKIREILAIVKGATHE